MNWRNSSERYGTLSIGMHWGMLLVMAAVYACIELREFFPKGSDPREALKTWHFMLGLSVFVLVSIRLAVRVMGPLPVGDADAPRWQAVSAKLVHFLLYVLMFAMPLAGWLLLSAKGKPVPFFGISLPALIAENKSLADSIKELHEAGGTLGYIIIGLHAAAALFHHHVVGDNTLRRMLPSKG